MQDKLSVIHPNLVLSPSKRARKVALRLDAKERVIKLVLPQRFPKRKALKFARDHKDWIADKLAALPAPIYLEHGVDLPVLGQTRAVVFDADFVRQAGRGVAFMTDSKIIVNAATGEPAYRLERFLKKEIRTTLTDLAHDKASAIGKTVSKVSVRDTKSRWGSCTDDGNLSFSWRLIFAPYETLDYLVAHEVAHLTHMNHSRAFWQLCRDLSMDYRRGKRWIKENSHDLMRYMVKT